MQTVKIHPIGCYRQAFELVQGKYWLLLGISAVGTLIAGSVPVILIGPMMCGIYACFLAQQRGDDFEFGLLFEGFELFIPGLIAGLIITVVTMFALMPALLVAFGGVFLPLAFASAEGGDGLGLAMVGVLVALALLTAALVVVVSMFFMFTFPLIVDRGLSGTDAVTTSVRAVARNFWGVLGLTLIGIALGLIGVLACYVGSLLILPISFAAMTVAYRKVFPESATES